MTRQDVGLLFRALQKRTKVTRRELARAANVDPSSLSVWQRGDCPRLQMGLRMVRVLARYGIPEADSVEWVLACALFPRDVPPAILREVAALLVANTAQQKKTVTAMRAARRAGVEHP